MFWNVIRRTDFCIDSNEDISHLFFMRNNQLLCSLEVTDADNFMIVYDDGSNLLDNEHIISNQSYNDSMCALYKDDIDILVEGELWTS